jgi:hypothetical protein
MQFLYSVSALIAGLEESYCSAGLVVLKSRWMKLPFTSSASGLQRSSGDLFVYNSAGDLSC